MNAQSFRAHFIMKSRGSDFDTFNVSELTGSEEAALWSVVVRNREVWLSRAAMILNAGDEEWPWMPWMMVNDVASGGLAWRKLDVIEYAQGYYKVDDVLYISLDDSLYMGVTGRKPNFAAFKIDTSLEVKAVAV